MPKNPEPLVPNQYYHIYNRGNDGETLFREERNYIYFLRLYTKYVQPVAETYAYCLLNNHFHLLVRIKDCQSSPSQAFSNLFSTYTKAINKAYCRTGSLFEKPFHRKRVDNDRYFARLVIYIHQNPQRHGLIEDFRLWTYSSFQAIRSAKPTHLRRQEVLDWFSGEDGYEEAHKALIHPTDIEQVIIDD